MSKYALVTRAKGIEDIASVAHPVLKKYAHRCKAEFIVIDEDIINCGSFHYEILQIYDLLKEYDRILHLDSDILIAPDCPNLLDIVPEEKIGLVFEDKYTRRKSRRYYIRRIQEEWGDIGWRMGYQNSGVMVCSRVHREVFVYDPSRLWNKWGYADLQLSYRIHELGFEIHELPFIYNHMSMFSEMGKNHLKSFVLHYAGRGFDPRFSRAEQMRRDFEIITSKSRLQRNFMLLYPRLRLLGASMLNQIRSWRSNDQDFAKVFDE